jgi:hypothetical protein
MQHSDPFLKSTVTFAGFRPPSKAAAVLLSNGS